MKNLSVRPGMTWKHVSEAIDKQKKDIYSWLSHNDKDYMNKVGQDLAYQWCMAWSSIIVKMHWQSVAFLIHELRIG